MDARAELEEAVRRTWDPVTLAVYADQLQADGDLRGELIALDLAIAARGPQPELLERRTLVEGRWLGLEDLPPDARWKIAGTEHGFVTFLAIRDLRPYEASTLDQVRTVLERAGRYVRCIELQVGDEDVAEMIETLGRAHLISLERLHVDRDMPRIDPTPYDRDAALALIAATPNLVELHVGHHVFDSFPHPHVERLRAYDQSIRDLSALTGVREAIFCVDGVPDHVLDLPALARLDISDACFTEPEKVWRPVLACPQLPQLEWLRMSPPRNEVELDLAQRALDLAAGLREIVVTRYEPEHVENAEALVHPRARIVLPLMPWPHPSTIVSWLARIEFAAGWCISGDIDLVSWIGHLDYEYPRLPVDTMVAVAELFERLAEPIAMISQTSTYVDLPTELVLRAVTRETLEDCYSFAQHLGRERDELPATTLVHLWIERNA